MPSKLSAGLGAAVNMMSDVECPYCGAEQEINHDDGYGMDEDGQYEQECGECEKTFSYTTSFLVLHEAKRADCLNGAPHKYKPTRTYPKRYTKMECEDCGYRRPCTEEEMAQVLSD